MNNLIIFAFKGNISSSVLEKLNVENKFYIFSNNQKIEEFVTKIISLQPRYILGLGMYSRKDKDKLRIETQLNKEEERLPINYFLTPLANTKLAQGMGNSYCNFISRQLMEAINSKKLKSEYTFIHIPKSFQTEKAANEIEEMLKTKVTLTKLISS
jgi:pyrrolidone-carboxylate peptidase